MHSNQVDRYAEKESLDYYDLRRCSASAKVKDCNSIFYPKAMSTGFHQVFPIIVQMAAMMRGEAVFIESPEAHLHPSAQVRLMEFFLSLVESGRTIIIETHSDLMIRAAIRGILSGDVNQGKVKIFIANSSDDGSKISEIQIDERGRIKNWPDGFMDESTKEDRRLMDVLYGK